jgi:hypothetical protein
MTTAERLQAILDAALVAANAAKQEPRARFSNAADCERALALDFTHGPREMTDVRHVLAAACGTAVGEVLEAGGAHIGAWAQQTAKLWPMVGNLDLRFPLEGSNPNEAPSGGEVWDWKVVGEKSWKRVKTEPNPKHLTQIHGYCAATRSFRWVLAYLRGVSIFKDEMEWRIYTGIADPARAEAAQAKWQSVLAHVKAKTLPVIPEGYGPETFPCATRGKSGLSVWCGHYSHCHPKEASHGS